MCEASAAGKDEEASTDPMANDATERAITHLERRIEALAKVLESCRKIMLVARLAIAAGALWIAATLADLVAFWPFGLVAAICAIIGGIVAYGSNASTARQSRAEMRAAEAERSALIDRMNLKQVVGPHLLH